MSGGVISRNNTSIFKDTDGKFKTRISTDGDPLEVIFDPVATPKIYNVNAVTSGAEYSQSLSTDVKKFTIKAREKAVIQLAYIATESSTNFITIPAGAVMFIDGLKASSLTLYFQADKSNTTIEIQEWT